MECRITHKHTFGNVGTHGKWKEKIIPSHNKTVHCFWSLLPYAKCWESFVIFILVRTNMGCVHTKCAEEKPQTTTLDLLKALIVFNQCSFGFLLKLFKHISHCKSWRAFKLLHLFGMICRNILQWSLQRLALAELHSKGKTTVVLQNLMYLEKHCCTLIGPKRWNTY